MARWARVVFGGATYHVIFRGNARERIFRDDRDRVRLLESLAERVVRYRVRLYLYVLMRNHVHLLVETPDANLPTFMGSLLTSYTTYFNLRHNRDGHLTQGRYKSPLVEGDEYLLRLSRYIHQNPVYVQGVAKRPVAERVEVLRLYRWSSYRAYAGLAEPDPWVTYGPVQAMTPGLRKSKATKRYQQYVETGLAETDTEFRDLLAKSDLAVGSEAFVADVRERHAQAAHGRVRREDLAFRKQVSFVPVPRILEAICQRYGIGESDLHRRRYDDGIKPVAAALLTRLGGLSQRAAAEHLGLTTGAAVCLQLRRLKFPALAAAQKDLRALEQMLNI